MSKGKAYTQLILERLSRKAEDQLLKSTLSSNQTTQATPNDSSKRTPISEVRHFFDHFDKNATYFHETVVLHPPPTKRCLYWDLSQIQAKQQRREGREGGRERITTQPVTSEFNPEKRGLKVASREVRDNKSSIVGKRSEERMATNCKTQQSQILPRYRSLKTLPSTLLPATNTNTRRVLVYPAPKPEPQRYLQFRESRPQVRRGLKKCESFEKYLQARP